MHLAVHNIKQREGESVRAFATGYTDDTLHILGLHKDQCISGFVHGLKARNLVEHLSTDLPSTYKGLMEKTYTWIEAREVTTNGVPNDQRDNFESLSKSLREILATKEVAKTFEQPTRLPKSEWKEEKKKAKLDETHVLMISRKSCNPRKRYAKEDYNKVGEITFPPVTKDKIIMEYLVKISKKARILELKRRHLKITVLTTNTSYPSRKIRRICACTSQKTTKEQDLIRRIQRSLYAIFKL
ncbi:hypothetical protein Tco_0519566 [Tanacetum coccineum]